MDFKNIVSQLIDCGFSEKSIAEDVGTSQPTIHRLKTGQYDDPKYSVAKKLIDLHSTVVGDKSKNAA